MENVPKILVLIFPMATHKRSKEKVKSRHGIKEGLSAGELMDNSSSNSRMSATNGKHSVQQGSFSKWNYGVTYPNNKMPFGSKNLGTNTLESVFNPETKIAVTKIDTIQARKNFGYFISTNRMTKKELSEKANEKEKVA